MHSSVTLVLVMAFSVMAVTSVGASGADEKSRDNCLAKRMQLIDGVLEVLNSPEMICTEETVRNTFRGLHFSRPARSRFLERVLRAPKDEDFVSRVM